MTKLFIKVTKDSNSGEFTYITGKLNFIVTPDDSICGSDDYAFSLYNDYLNLLLRTGSDDSQTKRKDNMYSVQFRKKIILLPGHYFLLFRVGEFVLRFDLEIAPGGKIAETDYKVCELISMESILGKRISNSLVWEHICSIPGRMQWKKWAIYRKQQLELNLFRSKNKQWMFDYCDNMLISSDAKTSMHMELSMFVRHAINRELGKCTDCMDLLTDNSPYHKTKEVFNREIVENILGLDLPDMKDKVYVFYNADVLLKPEMKDVLNKILEEARTVNSHIVLCGSKAGVDKLLETRPEVDELFPVYNRLEQEEAGIEELILQFFHEIGRQKVELSPEATDAVCRFLYKKLEKDRSWSRRGMHNYITYKVIPAYTHRAITAILQGEDPKDVLRIMPEDLTID